MRSARLDGIVVTQTGIEYDSNGIKTYEHKWRFDTHFSFFVTKRAWPMYKLRGSDMTI